MLTLSPTEIVSLPVDDLALRVVRDFVKSGGWNQYNYMIEHQQNAHLDRDSLSAISEALGWATAHGLFARTPGNNAADAVFVTRAGHAVISQGLGHLRAAVRLSSGLHPLIERRARPQFLLGELEQAVFVSMKAVEVRVRQLAAFGDDQFGVDMMNRAFGPTGPLTDPEATKGEQEGTRAMFGGAYAVLRNPSGHRDVDYTDPAEAAESVVTASLLMRILDRVEARLSE